MKINLSLNNSLSNSAITFNTSHNNKKAENINKNCNSTNKASISSKPQANLSSGNNSIEALKKQKEQIQDAKNSYKEYAAKNNLDPKESAAKLQEYDSQIQNIDKQIAQIELENRQKSDLSKNHTNKDNLNKSDNNCASDNNATNESTNNILELSNNFETIKLGTSQKNILSSKARCLEADIEYDRKYNRDTTSSSNLLSKIKENAPITENLLSHSIRKALNNSGDDVHDNSTKTNQNNSKQLDDNSVDNDNEIIENNAEFDQSNVKYTDYYKKMDSKSIFYEESNLNVKA